MRTPDAFDAVRRQFESLEGSWNGGPFFVPGHLRQGRATSDLWDAGDPHRWFGAVLSSIGDRAPRAPAPEVRMVYWWHSRVHASLNGRPGSAIAQIAFLDHLVDLGVTDVVLLPTAEVGQTNRKGTNGSPFAVRNPFALDASMAEPLLGGAIEPTDQHRAFVHACHLTGLRIMSIVPLATLAIDSPIFALFPEMGFWWEATPDRMLVAATAPPGTRPAGSAELGPVLPDWAIARFRPAPHDVHQVGVAGRLHHVGLSSGGRVSLANAMPDVVAGDSRTYTWADSAAIRYGGSHVPHPMGLPPRNLLPDPLAVRVMATTLAFRWADLGEDGAVIDVSPNVPAEVLETAQLLAANWSDDLSGMLGQPDLAHLDAATLVRTVDDALAGPSPASERWLMAEELWRLEVPATSYRAVTGPLAYSVGAHARDRETCIDALELHARALVGQSNVCTHLAAAALHDTLPPPPALWLVLTAAFALLPGAVPAVYSGTEHGSTHLTNAEFGFNDDPRLADFRTWTGIEGLSLFEAHVFDWTVADSALLESTRRLVSAISDFKQRLGSRELVAVTRLDALALQYELRGTLASAEVTLNLHPLEWQAVPMAGQTHGCLDIGSREFSDGRRATFVEQTGQPSVTGIPPTSVRLRLTSLPA